MAPSLSWLVNANNSGWLGFFLLGFFLLGFFQPGFFQPGFFQLGFFQLGFFQRGFFQPGFLHKIQQCHASRDTRHCQFGKTQSRQALPGASSVIRHVTRDRFIASIPRSERALFDGFPEVQEKQFIVAPKILGASPKKRRCSQMKTDSIRYAKSLCEANISIKPCLKA